MDGQRRVAESLSKNKYFRKDCPAKYRAFARIFAVVFLLAAIARGVVSGGHLEYAGSPWPKLPGHVAGLVGLAAYDIEVSGLQHHEPDELLAAINVKPGNPLIGFDAKLARSRLESLNWIATANVTRRFPNQLHISVTEREPFVVWQHEGKFTVVDQRGEPMTGISPSQSNMLLQVVGEGANVAAFDLVNQMEASPGLMRELRAAVRVGDRRWNLQMQDGVTMAMPEASSEADFRNAEAIYFGSVSNKLAVAQIDLRIAGQVVYRPATLASATLIDPTTTSSIE